MLRRSAVVQSLSLVPMVVFALLLLCSLGCAKVVFDLSDIEEPVMLNALPYSGADWSTKEIDTYAASASYATGASHRPDMNADVHSQILETDAQIKAFEAIGGHSRRAISMEEITVWAGGGNLLLVFMELAQVDGNGQVVEITGTGKQEPKAEGGSR